MSDSHGIKITDNLRKGAVVAWRLESWACNLKVAGSIPAPAGIEGGDCE